MKKIIIRLFVLLIVLLLLAAVLGHLFLDGQVKRLVESIGPKITKVSVKVQRVNLILLSGTGKITGLEIGNPEGYKSPSAILTQSASLSLQPASLLSDKIVIKSINLKSPEVTFETDLTKNNLSKILSNLEETTGGSKEPGKEPTQPQEPAATKKLQVDDFLITGGKLHVIVTPLGGKSATVPLPEIHLTNLGQSAEGITPAELTKAVLQALETAAAKASASAIDDLQKGAVYLGKEVATNTVNKVTRGLGDLLKKK